jgi:hypothetical protein
MSQRVATLWLVMAVVLCAGAGADWLVLRGGKKIETAGPWKVRNDLIVVHEATGRTQALTFEVVDFPATLQANVRAGMPSSAAPGRRVAGSPAGEPGGVDLETIKRLQEVARLRAEAAAQARRLSEEQVRAALSGVAPKQPRTEDQSPGSLQAKPARSEYNNGLANCAIWQDRPKLYSDCLAGYH